jgi:hypothetical protein
MAGRKETDMLKREENLSILPFEDGGGGPAGEKYRTDD